MNREFPELLAQLHTIEIDYNDGEGIDFEPYDTFYDKSDTAEWIKAWTGNNELDGSQYLIFGQDGTGGYAAFWLVKESKDMLEQPIVFFGSEGELGVVACNFYEYLWLFANGIGPYEAVAYPGSQESRNEPFYTFAEKHALSCKSSASEVIARAVKEYPNFNATIEALCR